MLETLAKVEQLHDAGRIFFVIGLQIISLDRQVKVLMSLLKKLSDFLNAKTSKDYSDIHLLATDVQMLLYSMENSVAKVIS